MEKRYQVFVSSTYADLKEERQHVIQALMEMDCIPAGMELFPAADEEQWEFIKRVIDDCDYYLLIIGGRYGSVTPEGISYTEKEYDYAVDIGLKVIALIHEAPDDIPMGKSDLDPELRARLQAFRERVSENRLVRFWKSAEELPGFVALSLSKTIKTFPAVGWVRADTVGSGELLSELNDIRKENSLLKSRLSELDTKSAYKIDGLADLDENFTVRFSYLTDFGTVSKSISSSWAEMFAIISPYLVQNPNHELVKIKFQRGLGEKNSVPSRSREMNDEDFETIGLQFKALGLVNTEYLKTTTGKMALFWSLTHEGKNLMMQLRTISTSK